MGRGAATSEISQSIRDVRVALGMSQAGLAKAAGLTRQAINSVEAGYYVPNTTVALRLAQALRCRVEDLFSLPGGMEVRPVHIAGESPRTPGRVVVGRVRGRYVAHRLDASRAFAEGFAAADGLLDALRPFDKLRTEQAPSTGSGHRQDGVLREPQGPAPLTAAGKVRLGSAVRLLVPEERLETCALVLGCDPSLGILAAHVSRRRRESRVAWVQATSAEALRALSSGEAHVAGSHLWDAGADDYNIGPARAALRATGGRLVCFASWEQGLAVAPGNPRGIRGVSDLARPGVTIINREPGAGARELLDRLLAEQGVPSSAVAGYDRAAGSHVAVARAVASGGADAGVAIRAVADAHGLGFVTLAEVRFDLAIPEDQLDHPAIEVVLDTMHGGAFRAELNSLPGYDTARTGETVLQVAAKS